MNNSLINFGWSMLIAVVLTGISYGVAVGFGWTTIPALSIVEIFAVLTSYSCTWLCVVQSRWNYPIGAISIALYGWMFWQSHLFASMALQVYLFPVMLYGWFRWRSDANTRPVTSVFNDSSNWIAFYLFMIGVAWTACFMINLYFGGAMALMDTAIFVASILAQFLLDNKKIENWIVWFIVNIVSLYVYWKAGLFLIFLQYVFFTANTVYGFIRWNIDDHSEELKFGRSTEA